MFQQPFGGGLESSTRCGGKKLTMSWSSSIKLWKRLRKYSMPRWGKHSCTCVFIQRIAADQTNGEGSLPAKKASSPFGSNRRPQKIYSLAEAYIWALRGVKVSGIDSLCSFPGKDRQQMEATSCCQAGGFIRAAASFERGLERHKRRLKAAIVIGNWGYNIRARKWVHWRRGQSGEHLKDGSDKHGIEMNKLNLIIKYINVMNT